MKIIGSENIEIVYDSKKHASREAILLPLFTREKIKEFSTFVNFMLPSYILM